MKQIKLRPIKPYMSVLEMLCKLIAPVAPFFSDWLYINLNKVTKRENISSVHLANYPYVLLDDIDEALEERMRIAQDACSLLLSLRKKANIKVRQPLQKALIPLVKPELKEQIEAIADIIRSEVNIKEIEFIAGDNAVIKKKIKANFKTLGARLGSKMKAVANDIQSFQANDINELEQKGEISRQIENEEIVISLHDVEITSDDIPGLLVANKGALTVALNIELTNELIEEGLAREFVNKIQKLRKDADFDLTDRITLFVDGPELLKNALTHYNSYICTEILANEIKFSNILTEYTDIEVNEYILKINITKQF